jgi:hypothetical protein
MATDRAILKQVQTAQLESTGASDGEAEVKKLHYRTYSVLVADAATAGTAVTETVIATVPVASRVVAVKVATPIGVTAHDTNYATFTVSKRTAGGGATSIASQTTKITGGSGNLTAFSPLSITPTASAVDLAANDSLTIAIPKAASGVALTAATSYVQVQVTVEEI